MLTLPFDVVKKRYQVSSFDYGVKSSTVFQPKGLGGPIALARHMVTTEGYSALFRGGVPALLKAGPNSAIIFATYDLVSRLLEKI
jgi:hypothetical protein